MNADGKATKRWDVLQEIGDPKKAAHAMACFKSFLLAAVSAATEGNNGRMRVILRVLLIDGTGYL
jgi:hypothetical protein